MRKLTIIAMLMVASGAFAQTYCNFKSMVPQHSHDSNSPQWDNSPNGTLLGISVNFDVPCMVGKFIIPINRADNNVMAVDGASESGTTATLTFGAALPNNCTYLGSPSPCYLPGKTIYVDNVAPGYDGTFTALTVTATTVTYTTTPGLGILSKGGTLSNTVYDLGLYAISGNGTPGALYLHTGPLTGGQLSPTGGFVTVTPQKTTACPNLPCPIPAGLYMEAGATSCCYAVNHRCDDIPAVPSGSCGTGRGEGSGARLRPIAAFQLGNCPDPHCKTGLPSTISVPAIDPQVTTPWAYEIFMTQ
jgi:hypothetical protein